MTTRSYNDVIVNNHGEEVTITNAKVMVNGDIIFKTTGDVLLYGILSECYTANDATASTLQYQVTNNNTSTSANMSGTSASLANAAIGVSAVAQLGALTNAPVLSTAAGVGVFPWGNVRIASNSDIKLVIGVGSTTGTWKHYVIYRPLDHGATIVANQ